MKQLFYCSICFVMFFCGCQKNDIKKSDKFDVAAAKEWYYGVFKKSADFNNFMNTQTGAKGPKWDEGVYKVVDSKEIVEFPLILSKKKIKVSQDDSTLSENDMKRIADGSITTISFIKENGKVAILENQYIPTFDYLKKNNFDVSKVIKNKNDFSGRQVVKRANTSTMTTRVFNNGKITLVAKPKRSKSFNNITAARNAVMIYEGPINPGCTYTILYEYETYCTDEMVGDWLIVTRCIDWVPTGNFWIMEEQCPPLDCETNPDDPGCATPPENPEEPEDENCGTISASAVLAATQSVSESILEGTTILDEAPGLWVTCKYKTTFETGNLLHWSWNCVSVDKFTRFKFVSEPESAWKWINVEHSYSSQTGITPINTELTLTEKSITTAISQNQKEATMRLDYQICSKLTCGPVFQPDCQTRYLQITKIATNTSD